MLERHPDKVDQADKYIEQAIAAGVEAARATPVIKAIGRCLECDEPLPQERRWCDADCRDTWEQRSAA